MTAKHLKALLDPESMPELGRVLEKAQRLENLTDLVREALPGDLGASVVAVDIQDTEAIVVCESSTWAARLRFEEAAILKALGDASKPASRLKVRVARKTD